MQILAIRHYIVVSNGYVEKDRKESEVGETDRFYLLNYVLPPGLQAFQLASSFRQKPFSSNSLPQNFNISVHAFGKYLC